jgi:hypothetical protein
LDGAETDAFRKENLKIRGKLVHYTDMWMPGGPIAESELHGNDAESKNIICYM